MPQGANINTNISNGTKPNKQIDKILTKFKVPNHFSKTPQFKQNLEIFCII